MAIKSTGAQKEPSVRIMVRIRKGIHERLVAHSEKNEGASLNNIINNALDVYLPKKRGA